MIKKKKKITIDKVYNCFKDFIVLKSKTIIPPPSTVSIVLAKRFGVKASKSYLEKK